MAKLRVGILFGGRSGEHEVSLLSAASVFKAIDQSKYEVVPIGITKDGRWLTSADAERLLQGKAGGGARPTQAQLRAGDHVHFSEVSLADAQRLLLERDRELERFRVGLSLCTS